MQMVGNKLIPAQRRWILLAEDDDSIAESVAREIKAATGFEARIVGSIDKLSLTVQKAAQRPATAPALVISDWRLPLSPEGGNFLESALVSCIRDLRDVEEFPLVVYSAFAPSAMTALGALALSDVSFVSKMDGVDRLILVVRAYLAPDVVLPTWPPPQSVTSRIENWIRRASDLVGGVKTLIGVVLGIILAISGLRISSSTHDASVIFQVKRSAVVRVSPRVNASIVSGLKPLAPGDLVIASCIHADSADGSWVWIGSGWLAADHAAPLPGAAAQTLRPCT